MGRRNEFGRNSGFRLQSTASAVRGTVAPIMATGESKVNSITGSVIHPTDFSDLSFNAFAHALKISLATKCKLYIVHVAERSKADEWEAFPRVRETLARWGLADAKAPTAVIFEKLGVEVVKVEITAEDPAGGLWHFFARHPSDLLVLATRGREGPPRWIRPSVAEAMSRRARTETLFIPPRSAGFVDEKTGAIDLERIVFPVDHNPSAQATLGAMHRFCHALGVQPAIHALHVGADAPALSASADPADTIAVELRTGNVVDNILQAATEMKANLIVMPTAGHQGMLDALRGSTTERVLRQAPCPVLAIPVM